MTMNHLPLPTRTRHPRAAPSGSAALINLQAQIYAETRDAERPVRQLMTWLLDRRNLEGAWDRVRSADGANTPGPDGVTCDEVRGQTTAWLARLADELYHCRYRP